MASGLCGGRDQSRYELLPSQRDDFFAPTGTWSLETQKAVTPVSAAEFFLPNNADAIPTAQRYI